MPIVELADAEDERSKTYVFQEGHTFGNALRSIVSRYPEVLFCGYTVPHPSENKINFRIQTCQTNPVDILKRGLTDLELQCAHISQKFSEVVDKFKNPMNINELNDNCLAHIFSFLPLHQIIKIERVCKRWQQVCPLAWPSCITYDGKQSYLYYHSIFAKCGRSLKNVRMTAQIPGQSHTVLEELNQYCKNLSGLYVEGLIIPMDYLNFQNYPFLKNLRCFNLTSGLQLRIQNAVVSENILSFLKNADHLEDFSFTDADNTHLIIKNFGKEIYLCQVEINLDELFKLFKEVTDLRVERLPESETRFSLAVIPNNLTSLKVLHISYDFKGNSYKTLGFKNLNSLCFAECEYVDDDVMNNFMKKCPLLTNIQVYDCPRVSRDCLRRIDVFQNKQQQRYLKK